MYTVMLIFQNFDVSAILRIHDVGVIYHLVRFFEHFLDTLLVFNFRKYGAHFSAADVVLFPPPCEV
jgi:hypothetical protein